MVAPRPRSGALNGPNIATIKRINNNRQAWCRATQILKKILLVAGICIVLTSISLPFLLHRHHQMLRQNSVHGNNGGVGGGVVDDEINSHHGVAMHVAQYKAQIQKFQDQLRPVDTNTDVRNDVYSNDGGGDDETQYSKQQQQQQQEMDQDLYEEEKNSNDKSRAAGSEATEAEQEEVMERNDNSFSGEEHGAVIDSAVSDGDVDVSALAVVEEDVGGNEKNDISGVDNTNSTTHHSLGRGISGLPLSETPALMGAEHAHIDCDVDVDALAYWNDPQGTRDREFESPFISETFFTGKPKYLTFSPDRGGWNNVRMSLEIILIIAAASGRTLVLPPDVPLYLMSGDVTKKHSGFGNFFPLHQPEFKKRVPVITMEEFLKLEGGDDGQFPIPESIRDAVLKSGNKCDYRKISEISCDPVFEYLATVGYTPNWNADKNCLIFDKDKFEGGEISKEAEEKIKTFCKSDAVFFEQEDASKQLLHLRSGEKDYRLLAHFYGFLLFTDPVIDNYYKRFVRDFLHYHDEIYCSAGKIILSLQEEGKKRGFDTDREGGSGYSSMHVRRGDLQFKKVKISAEEWYDNLSDTWQENEIIFIATDERNKTFFDPIAKHIDIKFLDDYWDLAGLDKLDPNYFGMIDTIVASRGRVFGGTYFSTFSGYISRMRGYHGMSMNTTYYGWKEKKLAVHEWKEYDGDTFSHEWPTGWIGIDGDAVPSKSKY